MPENKRRLKHPTGKAIPKKLCRSYTLDLIEREALRAKTKELLSQKGISLGEARKQLKLELRQKKPGIAPKLATNIACKFVKAELRLIGLGKGEGAGRDDQLYKVDGDGQFERKNEGVFANEHVSAKDYHADTSYQGQEASVTLSFTFADYREPVEVPKVDEPVGLALYTLC
jgi:hypothetical protein